MKVLICGLPGSGKSTLAKQLAYHLREPWWNADAVRAELNDWDFSEEGRLRQANRMLSKDGIIDFVCPYDSQRSADYIIWMDTISEGRFEDTNKIFEPVSNYDLRITEWITESQLSKCLEGFNHGTMDTVLFLRERMPRLVK